MNYQSAITNLEQFNVYGGVVRRQAAWGGEHQLEVSTVQVCALALNLFVNIDSHDIVSDILHGTVELNIAAAFVV